jgi:protein gp37
MATTSTIEWTEKTWNPVTGCVKISAGCKYCYAERMAKRLHAMGVRRYSYVFKPTLHHDLLDLPKRWAKPSIVFVNSMSDLFEDTVPEEFIGKVFETMCECPRHTFQVLTKRSVRLRDMARRLPWPSNVWMGVSVESEHVLNRVQDLKRVPARVRFISCEPLLAPLPNLSLAGIQWVIVGGESGPDARSMKADWVEEIYQKCRAGNVLFFFKQWGGVRKHRTGRILHGRTYDDMPITHAVA